MDKQEKELAALEDYAEGELIPVMDNSTELQKPDLEKQQNEENPDKIGENNMTEEEIKNQEIEDFMLGMQ